MVVATEPVKFLFMYLMKICTLTRRLYAQELGSKPRPVKKFGIRFMDKVKYFLDFN